MVLRLVINSVGILLFLLFLLNNQLVKALKLYITKAKLLIGSVILKNIVINLQLLNAKHTYLFVCIIA